jgi:hypothetical protein
VVFAPEGAAYVNVPELEVDPLPPAVRTGTLLLSVSKKRPVVLEVISLWLRSPNVVA